MRSSPSIPITLNHPISREWLVLRRMMSAGVLRRRILPPGTQRKLGATLSFNASTTMWPSVRSLRNLETAIYIFLAGNLMRARLVTNALVHQYLIPAVQLGAKVRADESGGLVDVMAAVRPLRPGSGCLWCNQLIDPHQLAVELKSDDERRAQAYGVEEPNPNVITLNAVSAAHAANDFLLYYLGLNRAAGAPLHYSHFHFLSGGIRKKVLLRKDAGCRECGSEGRYGKGLAAPLPCTEG